MSDISKLITQKDYDFLQTNEHLNDNIILLGLSGSRAYGTNIETKEHTSDYDLRGVALNSKKEILLGIDFEQVSDLATDSCIYSFNKFIDLVSKCNPNTIELLGLRPQDYAYIHPIGKELIDNYEMFLSKQAINTFCGYANAQLRRIENYFASEKYEQYKKEEHVFNSIKNSLAATIANYTPFKCENHDEKLENMLLSKNAKDSVDRLNSSFKNVFRDLDSNNIMKLYIDNSDNEELDVEIFGDFDFKHFPLRDFFNLQQDMSNIINQFNKLGKRNTKKDDLHLNKHAMHLVRLYFSAFDILENKKIVTYREKEHNLLMDIRNGRYMNKDGMYVPEFFELVDELEKRLQYDAKNTDLPDKPDYNKINDFKMSVNERIVKGDFDKIHYIDQIEK